MTVIDNKGPVGNPGSAKPNLGSELNSIVYCDSTIQFDLGSKPQDIRKRLTDLIMQGVLTPTRKPALFATTTKETILDLPDQSDFMERVINNFTAEKKETPSGRVSLASLLGKKYSFKLDEDKMNNAKIPKIERSLADQLEDLR